MVAEGGRAECEALLDQLRAAGAEHPALYCRSVRVEDINWLVEPPRDALQVGVRLRYRQPDQAGHALGLRDPRHHQGAIPALLGFYRPA